MPPDPRTPTGVMTGSRKGRWREGEGSRIGSHRSPSADKRPGRRERGREREVPTTNPSSFEEEGKSLHNRKVETLLDLSEGRAPHIETKTRKCEKAGTLVQGLKTESRMSSEGRFGCRVYPRFP